VEPAIIRVYSPPLQGDEKVYETPRQLLIIGIGDHLSCCAHVDLQIPGELYCLACVRPDVLEGVPTDDSVYLSLVYESH
jgi:hypothetical protein